MSTTASPFILPFLLLTVQTHLLLAAPASWPPQSGGWSSPFKRPSVDPKAFYKCINHNSESRVPFSTVYAPNISQSNFTSLLRSTIRNLRFLNPTYAKPRFIFTPLTEAHVQAAVICAGFQRLDFRVRSGGHDHEGLSYVSYTGKPFFIIDLSKLRSITVDINEGTAWAQSGATLGELYYRISEKSPTLGFPASLCTTVGIGGHITGGGYGTIMRKFGLAVDNVLDARIVDASGRILDRNAMGEELFWAIRGGSGGSFGIILSWKVRLVPVPETVTGFQVPVYLEQQGTDIMYKWQQVADRINENLFIRVIAQSAKSQNGTKTVMALYQGLFLGDKNSLLQLMVKSFPELPSVEKYSVEMSWIESVLYIGGFNSSIKPDYLLQAKPASLNAYKGKSDYLKKPILKLGLEGMWEVIMQDDGLSLVVFTPYGGRMKQIADDATPFPHRNVLCKIHYIARWSEPDTQLRKEEWVESLYQYMTPFVSKNPRETYANYRDLEVGKYKPGSNRSCSHLWGRKYFVNNFDRLVRVKGMVDPRNVFHHEQSIPTPWMINQCTKLHESVWALALSPPK